MNLFVSLVLALATLGAGIILSVTVPRWFEHRHRSAVMITIWLISLVTAVGLIFA
jgi:hypothetical protein